MGQSSSEWRGVAATPARKGPIKAHRRATDTGGIAPVSPTVGFNAFGSSDIGILVCDRAGSAVFINGSFCELTGESASNLSVLPINRLFERADLKHEAHLYRHYLSLGQPFRIEIGCVRHGGATSWSELSFTFPSGAADENTFAVITATDVTRRRKAEQDLCNREAHHRTSVALAAQIHWTASATGSIVEVSPRWAEVTGMQPEEALGLGWLGALHGEDVAPTLATWTQALETKTPVDVEYRLRTPGGSFRWFRARAAARLDQDGNAFLWYGTLENIDDRRHAEQALRESEERFRLAAQAAGIGIWDYDAVHDRREWSDEFKDMLGVPRDAPADAEFALGLVVEADRYLLQGLIDAVQLGDSDHHFNVTLRIRRADTGDLRWMKTSGWRIQAASGRLERILVTIRDVTDERTTQERVRWVAMHDALTHLPNRAHFTEAFESAIADARACGASLALVLFDVDNLKATNDTIGHDAGDLLLRNFASRLVDTFGENAFVSRLGGDEFAVFFVIDETDAAARITSMLDSLCVPFDYEGATLDCQATSGVSLFPRDGSSAADLLKAADIALYAGKATERGALCVFRPELRANMQRRASMLTVARTILRDDLIAPFYQPKIALSGGKLAGFEALLRWNHPARGAQSPATIAAAFEDYNLAVALGERMFERICRDIRGWLDRRLEFGSVAFNVSPAEFRREGLCDRVLERLHRSAIPPHLLEIEITESVFLGPGTETVAQTLDAFHQAGMRIALDDFGTGFASLTHLRSFPVDVIKIDRSFVSDIGDGAGNAAIVDAVIGLASRLEMDVVAEGVETIAQATYLARRGCALGQGYLFGPAIPEHEVGAAISEWTPSQR